MSSTETRLRTNINVNLDLDHDPDFDRQLNDTGVSSVNAVAFFQDGQPGVRPEDDRGGLLAVR